LKNHPLDIIMALDIFMSKTKRYSRYCFSIGNEKHATEILPLKTTKRQTINNSYKKLFLHRKTKENHNRLTKTTIYIKIFKKKKNDNNSGTQKENIQTLSVSKNNFLLIKIHYYL